MAGTGVSVQKPDPHLGDFQTLTVTSGAGTANATTVLVTSESLSTAAGSTYTLTLTNSKVAATSAVQAHARWNGTTQGTPYVTKVAPTAGQVVVTVTNIHATLALNGTIDIVVTVIA